jgi:hypothetical protein
VETGTNLPFVVAVGAIGGVHSVWMIRVRLRSVGFHADS